MPRRTRAFTLIEVLAASALLATLLVGVIVQQSRSLRQARSAQTRLAAIRLADKLLDQWWAAPGSAPLDGRGTFDEEPHLIWVLEPVDASPIEGLALQKARLTIVATGGSDNGGPVASTEILLPR